VRKITFGHRSEAGAVRMARLMTVAETANVMVTTQAISTIASSLNHPVEF
jgi:hypothetical protein